MRHGVVKKRILTAIVAFSFFGYGFSGALFGPTNNALKNKFKVELNQLSYGLTINAAMNCIGALFFGWTFNVFHRQRQYKLQLFGTALCSLATPFMKSITHFIVGQGISGFLNGGLLTVLNVLILEMWREGSNPYMQAVHFVYALGTMSAPLLCVQFVKTEEDEAGQYVNHVSNGTQIYKVPLLGTETESMVLYPYTIAGAFLLAAAISVTLYELICPYELPERGINKQKIDSKKKSTISGHFTLFVILSALSFGLFLNIETVTGVYIVTFLMSSELKIPEERAIYLNFVLTLSAVVMRGLCVFISAKLKAVHIICACFMGILMSNTLLGLFYNSSESVVIGSLILLGSSLSPVYPSLHAFVEKHIDETNIISAIFTVVGLLPLAITPLIISGSIEAVPSLLVLSNLASVFALIIVFGVLKVLAMRYFTPLKKACLPNEQQ